MIIPSYSQNNPHPTAVIREMRYMVRNSIAFHAPYIKLLIRQALSELPPGDNLETKPTKVRSKFTARRLFDVIRN